MCTSGLILNTGYYRDSFDRFGDDFCEEILQYLPLEDKARLECVSKQWKRCVFSRQRVFYDLFSTDEYFCGKQINERQELVNASNARLLKKCKAIDSLIIEEYVDEELLRIMIDACGHQLTSIQLDDSKLHESKAIMEYIGLKCGKTLTSMSIYNQWIDDSRESLDPNYYHVLFELCPDLARIQNLGLSDIIRRDRVLVPKLCDVEIVKLCESTEIIEKFVDQYKDTIKKLYIDTDFNWRYQDIHLTYISNLSNLTELTLICCEFNQEFAANIKSIGLNCKNIKRLKLNCLARDHTDSSQSSRNCIRLWNAINSFGQLNSFTLLMDYFAQFIDINGEMCFKQIKECKNLTHIKIMASIDDSLFADIHLYAPQIVSLKVETRKVLTDATLKSLAKLDKLKFLNLRMNGFNSEFTIKGMEDLIENRLHVKSFEMNKYYIELIA